MSERSFEEQLKREDLAQERRRQEVCDYDMLSSSRTAAPFPEASSVPNVCPAYKGDHCGLQALNECDREPTPYDTTLDMEVEDKLSGGDD